MKRKPEILMTEPNLEIIKCIKPIFKVVFAQLDDYIDHAQL